ncbi:MAG: hypothetical protein NTY38_06815, partial [Acidobacteria bacterium]|nr:hypothetical protein [Acidobacteriota bacterium]
TTNPSPASDVVLNAASQSPGAGLGSWISVVGQNFSGMTRVWGIDDFQSGKLPRSIEGISVALNDRDLAVQLISPDRVNALVFPSVSAGQSYFSVTNSLGTSVPLRVVVQDNDPAFFAVPDEGKKYAFAKHLDGTLVGRSGLFGPGLVARPARPGDTVNIFGTGFGRTDQTTPSDEALFGTHPLVDPTLVVLHVGASAALIVWAGAVRPGVYVVRAVVPNVEAGDQRLIIDLGRSKSLKEVYMTVQR